MVRFHSSTQEMYGNIASVMKVFLLGLLFCFAVKIKAEEEWGVRYTLPSERSWLGKIIPTREDIPPMKWDKFTFEGTNFYSKRLFREEIEVSDSVYYIQWGIPGTDWKLRCPELSFYNYTKRTTHGSVKSGLVLGFSVNLSIP